jgi:hypothetical protein
VTTEMQTAADWIERCERRPRHDVSRRRWVWGWPGTDDDWRREDHLLPQCVYAQLTRRHAPPGWEFRSEADALQAAQEAACHVIRETRRQLDAMSLRASCGAVGGQDGPPDGEGGEVRLQT